MSSRAVVRTTILALLVGALAGALWIGWQAWQVNRDLRSAVDDAAALQSAFEAGDEEASRAAFRSLEEHTAGAADRTSGATWSVLTRAPWFGDDARGVRLVADVADDLTTEGLAPLIDGTADLKAILPTGGRVPLDEVESLQAPVSQAGGAFARADERLADEDASGFVGPLRGKYSDLARRVADAADALSSADVALRLMPDMLGRQGTRNHLLVFQNNAEVRATGGHPGAVSVLQAQDGRMTLTRQVAAGELGATDEPVLPLSDAERKIYGDQLGTFFVDANFTPHFPRTAELMKARWEQVYDDDVDGVISLDPVALSYMLAATGPVSVGDVELTSENAVDELLHEVYVRYENPADQDEFFRQAARAVFAKVTSGGGDSLALLRALARGADEHRLYVHSFVGGEQALLNGRAVAGELVTESSPSPHVGVYLNDTTGAKMSYFLRTSVRVDSTSCTDGVQALAGTARLSSLAPMDAGSSLPEYVTGGGLYGIEPGAQLVAVRLYAPVDGSVDQIFLNSKPQPGAEIVVHETRQVATVFVQLKPQQTFDLSWRMKTGAGQSGDVMVGVTPGIEARNSSSVSRSSC